MQTLSKEELHLRIDELYNKIEDGKLFIYPTDTIYGLGCDATNSKAVDKIHQVKKRPKNIAFSVIAPSKEWIIENCYVNNEAEKWIDKLPGPYTLILKLKNHTAVANNVHPGFETLGIRIPNHWIKDFVAEIGKPVVTTSANLSGKSFMTSMEDLDNELSQWIDFTIYEGEKKGKPSTLIDLSKDKVEIKER